MGNRPTLNHPFFCSQCPNCGCRIEVRTVEQNGLFHLLCTTLSKQCDWPRNSGKKISVLAWKRLLISAWERAHGRAAEFYPALDGAGFDVVYRRSSRLSKKEFSELQEFATAWAAQEGVLLPELEAVT